MEGEIVTWIIVVLISTIATNLFVVVWLLGKILTAIK